MKTILVPTDGSPAADKALGVALDLAQVHGADLKLFHVLLRDKEPAQLLRLPELEEAGENVVSELGRLQSVPVSAPSAAAVMAAPDAASHPTPGPMLKMIGAHILRRALSNAAERGVTAEALELSEGPTAAAIVATADAVEADTIVMGARGLRTIDALTIGSVSQEVCRSAGATCIAVH